MKTLRILAALCMFALAALMVGADYYLEHPEQLEFDPVAETVIEFIVCGK